MEEPTRDNVASDLAKLSKTLLLAALDEQYRLEAKNYASVVEELVITRQQRDDAIKTLEVQRTREAELESQLEKQKAEFLHQASEQENTIRALRERAKTKKTDWKKIQKAISELEWVSSDSESEPVQEDGAEDEAGSQSVVGTSNTPPQYKRKSAPTRDDDLENQENSPNDKLVLRIRPTKRAKNDPEILSADNQVSTPNLDVPYRVPPINNLDDIIRLWEQRQPENGLVPLKDWARRYGPSTYGESNGTKLSRIMYIYLEWKDHCNADRATFETRFPNCTSLNSLHLKVTKARESRGEIRHRKTSV